MWDSLHTTINFVLCWVLSDILIYSMSSGRAAVTFHASRYFNCKMCFRFKRRTNRGTSHRQREEAELNQKRTEEGRLNVTCLSPVQVVSSEPPAPSVWFPDPRLLQLFLARGDPSVAQHKPLSDMHCYREIVQTLPRGAVRVNSSVRIRWPGH